MTNSTTRAYQPQCSCCWINVRITAEYTKDAIVSKNYNYEESQRRHENLKLNGCWEKAKVDTTTR